MNGLLMQEYLYHQTVRGEKTATRRIGSLAKMPDGNYLLSGYRGFFYPNYSGCVIDNEGNLYKPRFQSGDVVFVKEPICKRDGITYYRYRGDLDDTAKWSNKMFMSESDARLKIEITDVYAQRLGDISEDDVLKEGISGGFGRYTNYLNKGKVCKTAKESFATLIDSINGKGTFDSNPYVWVYLYRIESFLK